MKTILYLVLLTALFPRDSAGQNSPEYNKFYKSLKNEEGIVTFKIPPGLLTLFIEKEEKELKDLMKKVDDISLFIADPVSPFIFKELEKNLPDKLYHDIMVIRDGPSTINFKARESKSGFNEIIMSVEDKGALVVLCISGTFDHNDANFLARSMKVKDPVHNLQ